MPGIQVYRLEDIQFRGVIVQQMLVDKIAVVSSSKVFRRIKDMVDLYYLSQCVQINVEDVRSIAEKTNRKIEDFSDFMTRKDDLKHAYDKFRFSGSAEKPDFETVYLAVWDYLHDLLPCENTR